MAKILVVDDDAAMRRATCRVLQDAGHAVTSFENGAAASLKKPFRPADLLALVSRLLPKPPA